MSDKLSEAYSAMWSSVSECEAKTQGKSGKRALPGWIIAKMKLEDALELSGVVCRCDVCKRVMKAKYVAQGVHRGENWFELYNVCEFCDQVSMRAWRAMQKR